MKLIISADDFGYSTSITDNIVECFKGALSSTSIIPNAHEFDYAINKYNMTLNDKRLGIHINFFEGLPCSPPDSVSFLVDKDGFFRHSFLSLLTAYYLSSRKKREIIAAQVNTELTAQIKKVKAHIPAGIPLNIDSHQHFHMIPFIFKLIVDMRDKFDIGYIRIPKEKTFFHLGSSGLTNYFGPNIIKHFLLNYLSGICLSYLSGTHIRHPDFFVGVLFTGNMTLPSIKKALSVLNNDKDLLVEVLLHPGMSIADEADLWSKYPDLRGYYLSSKREREKEVLLSRDFSVLIEKLSQD